MQFQESSSSEGLQDMAGGYGLFLETIGSSACQCLYDQDFTLLYANRCFYGSTGYKEQEFRSLFPGLTHYLKDHPGELDKLKEALIDACDGAQRHFTADLRMPVKNGAFIWVRAAGTVTGRSPEGYPVFCAVFSDISDLVGLEEQKKQYFEWMMDEYVGNVYISDMDNYDLLYVNKTAAETLQSTSGRLIDRKCYDVIQGRTSPCPFCTNSRLCADGFYEWEFFNPVLDRTFMIKNRLINWEGRRARIELSHDMYSTEYKLAKKDQEREALLRTIPGGFARLDAGDCMTVLWYRADFLNVIGYTKEQFEEELHSQCTYIHPDDTARIRSILGEIRVSGESAVIESRIITHSGDIRILTMTLCYVSGKNNWDGLPSFYSVGIDITGERREQNRQRKALEDAYQSARVANSAKTNFLSTMSHDIRTPMNAIMGMAAIAQANLSYPDRVHDCLSKINMSSRHLLSLINEVLDMSKIESGKIDLAPEEVILPDLIQNISDMCRPLVTEKNLDFKIIASQVRHEKIIVDGDRLQQVLMNLLSNSIKYTPDGGVIVLDITEIPSVLEKRGQFEFTVSDNGIGMPEEYIPHIFEPFSRAEDSRISKIQGTGLGMAITENIVRMMNGSIDVKSQPGTGSRFTVSIQFELVSEEICCDDELAGLPVLVVDDDETVCESASALLNELGIRGSWVLSGAQAVEAASDAHIRGDDFFAVILDWKMPGMDGLQTLKAIRRELGDDVPIIIISAYDYSDIEEEFLRAGADAFITKPLFKSKMLHVLHLFLSCTRQESDHFPAEADHPALHGKRVLLAEDNELNREIALELLQMKGLTVDAVENGSLAVERFRASDPGYYCAILMDIQMPVMNGYDATSSIRRLDRADARTIPILALTANAFTADVSQARSVGMNDHIAVPFKKRNELVRVHQALFRYFPAHQRLSTVNLHDLHIILGLEVHLELASLQRLVQTLGQAVLLLQLFQQRLIVPHRHGFPHVLSTFMRHIGFIQHGLHTSPVLRKPVCPHRKCDELGQVNQRLLLKRLCQKASELLHHLGIPLGQDQEVI